jgi:hypothetical protein
VQGAALLHRRGLHRPSDLLDFDFVSYWQRWLRLYHRDHARLGRFDANRYGNRKRQHAVKRDTRRGAVLYHILSFTDGQPPGVGPRSLQQFVSNYRHGRRRPYLNRMPITLLVLRAQMYPCCQKPLRHRHNLT